MSDEEKAGNTEKVVYFMSIDKAKFRAPVTPGDQLVYKLDVIKNKGAIWNLDGKAYVDGKLVAQAELKAMIVDK
jgi:3-hydroxyacyl-[acyl-carrier-protein] dehydratase